MKKLIKSIKIFLLTLVSLFISITLLEFLHVPVQDCVASILPCSWFESRVTHFIDNTYTVEYSRTNGLYWERYTHCFFDFRPDRNFPFITEDLEFAKKCAMGLTKDELDKHNKIEDEKWYKFQHRADTTIVYKTGCN